MALGASVFTVTNKGQESMKQLTNTKGFTLVEVVVASAILAILAIMMVLAFTTMTNVSLKTSNEKTTDSGLEAAIAAGQGNPDYAKSSNVTPPPLEFMVGPTPYSIDLVVDEYTSTETGSGFTVFEFKQPATP
jgi:prepilin-type N-terminal cleavage/methylation domain-containing protein